MPSNQTSTPDLSELGKKSSYDTTYDPNKLFPLSRQQNRDKINIDAHNIPFHGFDLWNHYEVSWLNEKGKPVVALAEILYGCESKEMIESKSMKLYFNSFNNTHFANASAIQTTIKHDLEQRINGSAVTVNIFPLNEYENKSLFSTLEGLSIDDIDITCDIYHNTPSFLTTENEVVEEILCSDLLKSNCLVTNQPDWCSVQIIYHGKKINREGLLRYIVSFRNDNEFHEHCIEKIFVHIMEYCQPKELTVYGRSTRRGGLDINAIRSTKKIDISSIQNRRLCRQ